VSSKVLGRIRHEPRVVEPLEVRHDRNVAGRVLQQRVRARHQADVHRLSQAVLELAREQQLGLAHDRVDPALGRAPRVPQILQERNRVRIHLAHDKVVDVEQLRQSLHRQVALDRAVSELLSRRVRSERAIVVAFDQLYRFIQQSQGT